MEERQKWSGFECVVSHIIDECHNVFVFKMDQYLSHKKRTNIWFWWMSSWAEFAK